jgi:D-3-phosphoglycerate dehydrogenase
MGEFVVVIAEGSSSIAAGAHAYQGNRIEVRFAPFSTPEKIAAATADAHGVIVALQRLHRKEIEALGPRVRAISRSGIGLDNIDLDAAKERGMAVMYQPVYATDEVATHAVAMLLALNRRLMDSDRIVRTRWPERRQLFGIKPLHRMTVGVVGYGVIGRATVHRLTNLAEKVVVYDPYAKSVPAGVELAASLDELLKRSDAITLHAPLTPETRNLIGAREFALLPKGACVVNVARGELIDHEALIKNLQSGHISGAGLDVFPVEPVPLDDPLLATPGLLLSPHTAFASADAVARLHRQTAQDLFAYLTTGAVTFGKLAVIP